MIMLWSFYVIVALYFSVKLNCAKNNVCRTFKDYYTITNNSNCWYDFAADSNVVEIVTKNGYPLETHKVATSDGYILTMFRIPNHHTENFTFRKGPVLLQHGWSNSAAVFVARGRNSLAFALADAGYDVWLGNYRGTEYSEEHVNLTVYDKQYWDYSADELGLYDVPAQLELIAEKTDQKGNIVYIGHSLGTTTALIYGSSFPKLARSTVKLFIFLAPSADISHTRSSFFKTFGNAFSGILRTAQDNNFIRLLSHAEPLKNRTQQFCLNSASSMEFCIRVLNVLVAGRRTQMEPNLVPVLFNQLPAGMSFKVATHIADFSRTGFRRYNYGLRNMEKYGTDFPPLYDVSKIKVPIYIVYAINDLVCTKEDSLILYNQLSPEAKYGIHEISDPNFNHLDYAFGKNSKTLVDDHILTLLQELN